MAKLQGVAPCSIPGCPALYYGRGWCQRHYMRWYRSGDPLGSTLQDPGLRFESFTLTSPDTECLLWIGAISDTGYGNFWLNGGTVLAHRFSYERTVGPIPEGLQIDHLCRVRRCVSPDHLEAVTPSENNIRVPVNSGRFGSRPLTEAPA